MRIREIGAFAGCAAFALLVGLPAAAIDDVTGTYTGKLSCRDILAGAASKSKQDVSVLVLEGKGGGVALDITAGATTIAQAVVAFLVEDAAKADRGTITGPECGLDVVSRLGATVHAEVTIKAGSENGKLKGTLIGMDDESGLARICTFTAKRTSTADPTVVFCF